MSESLRPVPTADQVTLKALSTRRRQLTELIAIEKTRLAQALDPMIVDSHRAVLQVLTQACAEVEAELDRRIAADPALARKRTILTSIPGIGRRIAGVLITDMPELGRIDRKAAASLADMAPHPSQSGAHPGRHAIAGGRPCLRTAFYMAGMVAARACPAFRKPYRAMRDAGKPAKLAIVATGRRLVTLANALIRDDKTFDQSNLLACEATSGTAPLVTTGAATTGFMIRGVRAGRSPRRSAGGTPAAASSSWPTSSPERAAAPVPRPCRRSHSRRWSASTSSLPSSARSTA
ncbi:hypothetical protein GMJLKIPL_6649 [Methylobacterium isbiliense]|uniref:Transposase IS116/IS110/IS902 C-terminal domain-containing protein n=1 Tax=Methylobacterium isbiliense TaxID=315478 RepID=A0ABQ4SS71_9HYPH|nr:hypothetical protein GMJLKIPL_6649 [Methylobacterium isbiliense]